jgi:hypothetical protein
VPNVLKPGCFSHLEPSGPVQACNGIALPSSGYKSGACYHHTYRLSLRNNDWMFHCIRNFFGFISVITFVISIEGVIILSDNYSSPPCCHSTARVGCQLSMLYVNRQYQPIVPNACVYIHIIQTKFHMAGSGSSPHITFKLKLKLPCCYFRICKKFAQFLRRHYYYYYYYYYYQQLEGVTGHEVNTKF